MKKKKESFPDVAVPMIFTTVNYTGISPEDGERLIAKPLEKEFKTISGLKQIDSKCYEGYCRVKLDFIAGYDIEKGLRETKDAVDDAKANMPSGIDEPIIKEINTSEFDEITEYLEKKMLEKCKANRMARYQDLVGCVRVNTRSFGGRNRW